MANVVVRPAEQQDLEQAAKLWTELYQHQRDHGMILPLRSDAEVVWKEKIVSQLGLGNARLFVAVLETEVIGFVSAQIKRLPPFLASSNPRVGFISELYVRPNSRHGGTGRALVEATLRWMDEKDVSSVELQVIVGSEAGQSFWKRIGFVDELLQMRMTRSKP